MVEQGVHSLVFSGSSHPELAGEVAGHLGQTLGRVSLGRFPDGEVMCAIGENVRGRDLFVIQSLGRDPDRYLMEVLSLIDALKRSSARSIVAVLPYLCYARQDRVDQPNAPITAKVVANLLQSAGATAAVTFDLHTAQVEGFFDIPIDNLSAVPILAEAFRQEEHRQVVVVAPDLGSVKLARQYASQLGVDLVIVDKERKSSHEVSVTMVIGDVKGKCVLLADDMCSTGGTLTSAANACREKGAKQIFAAVTHGLFVGHALEKIDASPIERVWVSNTLPQAAGSKKIQPVSIAPYLSDMLSGATLLS